MWTGLIDRLVGRPRAEAAGAAEDGDRLPRVKTELSATVFSGEAESWVRYLNTPPSARHDGGFRLPILWDGDEQRLAFRAAGDDAQPLADCLNAAVKVAESRLARMPFAAERYRELIFANHSNGVAPLQLLTSSQLPTEASRETELDRSLSPRRIEIVLRTGDCEAVLHRWRERGSAASDGERLGIAWPVLVRVLNQLGFPSYPRDRFVEKIDVTAKLAMLTVQLLYKDQESGRLVPNRAGRVYQRHVAEREGLPEEELPQRDSWFRLLTELAFTLDERSRRGQDEVVQATVRDFLDPRYLRLSLSGVMPDLAPGGLPRRFEWKRGEPLMRGRPRVGSFGIFDADDRAAWKKVERPFREMGFSLLRQVGIGQFGRVYEALNHHRLDLPARVALKVDRFAKGERKEAIQQADVTMKIGRDLSAAPHVIRIFDAGKLEGVKYTYHVLQLVDGDTLDNLAGFAGTEHASVAPPAEQRGSEGSTRREYLKAVAQSAGEAWRWRAPQQFTEQLSLAQALDLLTSILLWLEEIHDRGYAINDLKNGNLMMSRRGQLKGIDLDAYAPLTTPLDKMADFYFLAISILLLFVNLPPRAAGPFPVGEHVLGKPAVLREVLESAWSFGDIAAASGGRVERGEVIDLLQSLILRCRDRTYVDAPAEFAADIDRLIRLKRTVFLEEIVVD